MIPSLVFAYFIPTILTTIGVIPSEAGIYHIIKTTVLPASLFLLTMSVDIRGIIRLGSKPLIMFLAGTVGIVIGGPIAFLIFKSFIPPEMWRGLAALSGSWIGGGANFIAIGKSVKASDQILGLMVIVDVVVANAWTGILFYLSAKSKKIDKKNKADTSAIEDLKKKAVDFQQKTRRHTTTGDFLVLLAMAFGLSWLSGILGNLLPPIGDIISHGTWKIILITTFGVGLSFTRFRNYEGAGASSLGSAMLYLLIGVIGANASLLGIFSYPILVLVGVVWIAIHMIIMFVVMKVIKAPLFFMAVGSQANVGGAASAPIVASAFHPSLASVGVMLGIAGYVLGTYAALICASLLQAVSTV